MIKWYKREKDTGKDSVQTDRTWKAGYNYFFFYEACPVYHLEGIQISQYHRWIA